MINRIAIRQAEPARPIDSEVFEAGRELPTIYDVLESHQLSEDWPARDLMEYLRQWIEAFDTEFKLDLPPIALCVDSLPAHCLGHFRRHYNGFGLKNEIAINSRYLSGRRPVWQVLGTLLHEMLHCWQECHGTPSERPHHNSEFRQKAEQLGLLIDAHGVTSYAAHSPFKELLLRHGIVAPLEQTEPRAKKLRGDSKLKKWTCGCTNVRVAVVDFEARCLKCGNEFYLDDTQGRAKHAATRSPEKGLRTRT